MELKRGWEEFGGGGVELNCPYASFTPATPQSPTPTHWHRCHGNQPRLLVWKSEGANVVCLCARMTMVVLCGLYGDCVTAATARAIVMDSKTISLGILPPSYRFVTVSSLSCFPSFLPPLSSLPHCFLLSPPSVSPNTPLRYRLTLTCSRRAIYITGSTGGNLTEKTCRIQICLYIQYICACIEVLCPDIELYCIYICIYTPGSF